MIRGSLWTLVAAATGIPIGFVVNLVVARSLGPAGLGALATYAAIVGVAMTVINLGISQSTVQWIAEMRSRDVESERLHLIRNCVGYHAFIEGPAVAVIVVFLLHSASPWVWGTAVLAVLATQALGTSSVVLTATARNAPAAKLSMVAGLTLQATVVVVALATRSASATYSAQLIAGMLGPLLCLFVVRGEERRAFLHPLVFRRLPTGFLRYGLSACGASLVGTLVYGRSEIFVLEAHRLKVAAGIFALATGLAGQITVPMDSVMGPLLPTATGLLAEAPTRATEAATRTLRVTSVLASFTMATAVPLVCVTIPLLFGSKFEQARVPFLVLGIVSCLGSVTVPLTMFILATRNAGSMLRVNLACLAVDAGLAIGLVPLLGLWGAVAANAAAQLLSFGLLTVVAVKRVGIAAGPAARACRPLVLGFGATGLALAGALVTGVSTAHAMIASPIIGAVTCALGFRFLPGWRVSASDGALVEASLPPLLRPLFRGLARVFSLTAIAAVSTR
jgi:O-antigen/teichoic acid export membrane protein